MGEDEVDSWLNGRCHLLAIALHEATGLPLAAWFDTDGENGWLLHAFVMDGGEAVDALGRRPLDEVFAGYDWSDPDLPSSPPVPVTAEELLEVGGAGEPSDMEEARAAAATLVAHAGLPRP